MVGLIARGWKVVWASEGLVEFSGARLGEFSVLGWILIRVRFFFLFLSCNLKKKKKKADTSGNLLHHCFRNKGESSIYDPRDGKNTLLFRYIDVSV